MRWRVSLEPVEENGLPEIVLIAVEIAGGAVDRVAVADEAADGVGDPVAVGAVVGTADRDTKSNSMRRPRVRSRGLFSCLSAFTFSSPTLSAQNAEKDGPPIILIRLAKLLPSIVGLGLWVDQDAK
jgi:hypothetical protein